MKRLFLVSIITIAASLPFASIAQTANGPLTRAEARTQTSRAAQDHRMNSKVHYPDSQQVSHPDESIGIDGYGPQSSGSSESRTVSGHAVSPSAKAGLFAHH
jgi:hypothetical protein